MSSEIAVASAATELRELPLARATITTPAITPARRTEGEGLTSRRKSRRKVEVRTNRGMILGTIRRVVKKTKEQDEGN